MHEAMPLLRLPLLSTCAHDLVLGVKCTLRPDSVSRGRLAGQVFTSAFMQQSGHHVPPLKEEYEAVTTTRPHPDMGIAMARGRALAKNAICPRQAVGGMQHTLAATQPQAAHLKLDDASPRRGLSWRLPITAHVAGERRAALRQKVPAVGQTAVVVLTQRFRLYAQETRGASGRPCRPLQRCRC